MPGVVVDIGRQLELFEEVGVVSVFGEADEDAHLRYENLQNDGDDETDDEHGAEDPDPEELGIPLPRGRRRHRHAVSVAARPR